MAGWLEQWAGWLMVAGYVLEVLGLGLAARGLYVTWRENAGAGVHFLAGIPWLHRLWVKVRPPRPQPVTAAGGGALGPLGAAAGVQVGPPPETLDERVAALEAALLEQVKAVDGVRDLVKAERREQRLEHGRLENRVVTVEERGRMFTQRAIVSGVPRAVIGLVLVALGLALQGLATWATWGCPS